MATVLDYGEPEADGVVSTQDQNAEYEMEVDNNPQTTIAEIYNEDIDGPDGDRDRRTKFYPLPQDGQNQDGKDRERELQEEEELELEERIIGKEIPTVVPTSPFPLGSSDLRTSVLNLQGTPITQLSTSRLFAYITHFKALPLGLEWISDQSCNIVFSSFADARDGLVRLLSQKEYDEIASNQSDLIPETEKLLDENNQDRMEINDKTMSELLRVRKAKKLPSKLYTAKEKDLALKYSDPSLDIQSHLEEEDQTSTLPSDIPEIYRDFEKEDRLKQKEEYEAGVGGELKTLKSLRGQLFVRFALSSNDVKQKKSRDQSGWYKKYGDRAGKEVVGRLLIVGDKDERRELLNDESELTEPGLENSEPIPTLEDRLRASKTSHVGRSAVAYNNRSTRRREDLDAELDEIRNSRAREDGRERSKSPERTRDLDSRIGVRGRGGVRAPEQSSSGMSAWDNSFSDDYDQPRFQDDEDEEQAEGRHGNGLFRSRLISDEIEIQHSNARIRRRGRGRVNDRWNDGDAITNTTIKGSGSGDGNANGSTTTGRRKGRGRFKAAESNDLASRFGPAPGSEESLEGRLSAWR